MPLDVNLTIEGKIKSLDVGPDTVIVIEVEHEVATAQVIVNVREAWEKLTNLPNRVFVTTNAIKIKTLEPRGPQ